MPAEIESGFFLREGAWHGLGVVLDHPPTAAEAMEAASLDWKTTLEPVFSFKPEEGGGLYSSGIEGVMVEIPHQFAVTRNTDQKVLGVVGKRFRPLQNADAFGFFDFLVQGGDFQYESAGSLYDGRKVWVLASLKNGVAEVVPGDPLHAYVLLSHANDGSQSVEIFNTDIRVVCANTESMARATGNLMAGIRHTKNVAARVEELKESVAARHVVFAEALRKYRFFASKPINDAQVNLFVRRLFQQTEPEERQRKGEPLPRGGAEVVRLFSEGKGQDLPGVRGTHWAAYNAVTEYIDHSRGVGHGQDLSKRINSAWFGQGNAVKGRAHELLFQSALAA